MRLHDMVRGIIGQVNPSVNAIVWKSKGNTISDDGQQIPEYYDQQEIKLQVHSATGTDLRHDEFVNIQGERKVVYTSEQLYGVDIKRQLGGDVLEFYGRQWLVLQRLEAWEGSNWCKVLVAAQKDKVVDTSEDISDHDDRE